MKFLCIRLFGCFFLFPKKRYRSIDSIRFSKGVCDLNEDKSTDFLSTLVPNIEWKYFSQTWEYRTLRVHVLKKHHYQQHLIASLQDLPRIPRLSARKKNRTPGADSQGNDYPIDHVINYFQCRQFIDHLASTSKMEVCFSGQMPLTGEGWIQRNLEQQPSSNALLSH